MPELTIIVPIKQVPETSEVKMDEETGTMVRAGVTAIVNPLDLYAIEAALALKEAHGGRVTALSMGPANAASALREAIAMGCDQGVLLSDKRFAGADTWATASTLAGAVRRMGPFDLLICGERATDGDTGQVGPELASMLGLPIVTYVAGLELDGRVATLRRLVETGYETYRCPLPLAVTVVKEIAYPRLPTLRGKQRARREPLPVWDNALLELDPATIGLQGSPTRVKRISRPRISRQGERIVVKGEGDAALAVERIVSFLEEHNHLSGVLQAPSARSCAPAPSPCHCERSGAISARATEGIASAEYGLAMTARSQASAESGRDPHDGVGSNGSDLRASPGHCERSEAISSCGQPGVLIWTLAEASAADLNPVSFEVLARAALLRDRLPGARVAAVYLGPPQPQAELARLIAHGADEVLAVCHPALAAFSAERHARLLVALVREHAPAIFLAAATTYGRTLMPYAAAQLHAGLTADCTELEIEAETELLLQTRPAIGGNIMATIKTEQARPQMATVRPHSMRPLPPDPARCGRIDALTPAAAELEACVELLGREQPHAGEAPLSEARSVVSGGRGLGKAENFRMVEQLATALGAAVGGSREAVDRGWVAYPHQVGLSGKTVTPDLYVALGISGAIQHLAGMQTARHVIAINADPDAQIFSVADLGVVGNLHQVVPALIERLQATQRGEQ